MQLLKIDIKAGDQFLEIWGKMSLEQMQYIWYDMGLGLIWYLYARPHKYNSSIGSEIIDDVNLRKKHNISGFYLSFFILLLGVALFLLGLFYVGGSLSFTGLCLILPSAYLFYKNSKQLHEEQLSDIDFDRTYKRQKAFALALHWAIMYGYLHNNDGVFTWNIEALKAKLIPKMSMPIALRWARKRQGTRRPITGVEKILLS